MPQLYASADDVVEAEQLTPGSANYVAAWCGGRKVEEIDALDDEKRYVGLNVLTLDGPKRAQENDYIIKFPAGNFQVMPSHKFHAKYSRA